jgi:hypothetical protein
MIAAQLDLSNPLIKTAPDGLGGGCNTEGVALRNSTADGVD